MLRPRPRQRLLPPPIPWLLLIRRLPPLLLMQWHPLLRLML